MQEPLTASEKRRGWWIIGFFVALVVGSWIFPHSPLDGIIWCPFRRLTGIDCPGCGMTRSCVALVRGNIGESLDSHVFGLLMVVGLGVTASHNFIQNLRGVRLNWWGIRLWRRHEGVFWLVSLVMLLMYSVVRLFV